VSHELVKSTIEQRLLTEWLQELSPETRRTYSEGLAEFCLFLGISNVLTALNTFFALNQGEAYEVAQCWKNWLKERHVASSVNLRLSTLKSIINQANSAGRIPWVLKIKLEKAESYKDTRGPGEDGYAKLVSVAKAQAPMKAARDVAILQLLFGQAFRRETVAQMDVQDLNEKGYVLCHWKGYREKIEKPLGHETCEILSAWLKHRGGAHGPLFIALDMNGNPKGNLVRLTGKSIYYVISELGRKAGIRAWPHGLRHAGTTAALDATNGNVREVAKFTGHRDIRTVLRYDDNRKEVERDISDLISRKKK